MSSRATRPWRLLGRAVWNFYLDDGLSRAAAIAFYAVVSLAPALYLLGRAVRAILPTPEAVQAAVTRGAAFLPPEAAPVLRRIALSLQGSADGLVIVAVPGLLWVATSAFAALARAVNVAFGQEPSGRFWVSRGKSLLAASAAAVLLVLSSVSKDAVLWLERHRAGLSLPQFLGPGATWATYAALLGVSYAAFLSFYKILPPRRVSWRCAAGAAAAALVLWEGCRRLFGAVVARSPSLGLLPGTLAAVVSFLLWCYTAAAICVFGAEVAAVLAGHREAGPPARGAEAPSGRRGRP
jgi:membrane protein